MLNSMPVFLSNGKTMLKMLSNSVLSLSSVFILSLLISGCQSATTAQQTTNDALETSAQTQSLEIKVVVVTMFEIGEDDDDKPGEFQMWKEGQNLNLSLIHISEPTRPY